jgi:mutual gliding-motility protein MglA
MAHINYHDKELAFKIVYYGPGMSGKTTNLLRIHQVLDPARTGQMISLNTAEERTLFFDFLPLDLGQIGPYRLRFNMYTVPGQVYYEACRRLILEGADGVVFVADSEPSRLDENLESFDMLRENLSSYGLDWSQYPIVLQYNKRDLTELLPVGSIEQRLGLNGIPVHEAVATAGQGVMDTLRTASRMVIERFEL